MGFKDLPAAEDVAGGEEMHVDSVHLDDVAGSIVQVVFGLADAIRTAEPNRPAPRVVEGRCC